MLGDSPEQVPEYIGPKRKSALEDILAVPVEGILAVPVEGILAVPVEGILGLEVPGKGNLGMALHQVPGGS